MINCKEACKLIKGFKEELNQPMVWEDHKKRSIYMNMHWVLQVNDKI